MIKKKGVLIRGRVLLREKTVFTLGILNPTVAYHEPWAATVSYYELQPCFAMTRSQQTEETVSLSQSTRAEPHGRGAR